jgi:hypothetical protein
MAGNMQEMVNSFQSAEAGAMAVLGLAGAGDPASDPFNLPLGTNSASPLTGTVAAAYVGNLRNGPESVGVRVSVVGARDRIPPRASSNMGGWGEGSVVYTEYRVVSEHNEEGRSRTRVQVGVIKTNIDS